MWEKPQDLDGLQEILQGKEKTHTDMMEFPMNVIYLGTTILCGIFGSLMVSIIDYKSDIAAGFRTAEPKRKSFF